MLERWDFLVAGWETLRSDGVAWLVAKTGRRLSLLADVV